MDKIKVLELKIKRKLDEYLEFDSSELFMKADYLVIFGGAIRDIIAEQPINDIDIMCLSKSMKPAIRTIEKKRIC